MSQLKVKTIQPRSLFFLMEIKFEEKFDTNANNAMSLCDWLHVLKNTTPERFFESFSVTKVAPNDIFGGIYYVLGVFGCFFSH